jgi:hypothetical protein
LGPSGPGGRKGAAAATEDPRLEQLRQVKLAALVGGHWGSRDPGGAADESRASGQAGAGGVGAGGAQPGRGGDRGAEAAGGSGRVSGPFAGGATLLDVGTGQGWVLDDSGSLASLGAALLWARRQQVEELHLVMGGGGAAGGVAGVVARRAGLCATAPHVWTAQGRQLSPVAPAPAPTPVEPAAAARAWISTLVEHGAEVAVEHGVITGEVRGLEVARVVPDSTGTGWHVEVGVGHHDRQARNEMHPDEPVAASLDRVVALVRRLRVAGVARHPANTLARERWLRSVLVAHPELVGAAELRPVAPPLPRQDLRLPAPASVAGAAIDGSPLVVVCSTGVDLDLVPAAADTRHVLGLSHLAGSPAARLVLVVPDGDDYPVTRELAAGLASPAEIVVVPRNWESLG